MISQECKVHTLAVFCIVPALFIAGFLALAGDAFFFLAPRPPVDVSP